MVDIIFLESVCFFHKSVRKNSKAAARPFLNCEPVFCWFLIPCFDPFACELNLLSDHKPLLHNLFSSLAYQTMSSSSELLHLVLIAMYRVRHGLQLAGPLLIFVDSGASGKSFFWVISMYHSKID